MSSSKLMKPVRLQEYVPPSQSDAQDVHGFGGGGGGCRNVVVGYDPDPGQSPYVIGCTVCTCNPITEWQPA